MEPEGSLPHSQASAICPCPGPAQSSPHTHIPPLGDPSQYYPPIYAQVSAVVSFPPVSPPRPYTPPSPHPYAPHAQPISLRSAYKKPKIKFMHTNRIYNTTEGNVINSHAQDTTAFRNVVLLSWILRLLVANIKRCEFPRRDFQGHIVFLSRQQ